MTDPDQPTSPPVLLFHPASGQYQHYSAASWERELAHRQEHGADIEGGLHGWQLAPADKAAVAAIILQAQHDLA